MSDNTSLTRVSPSGGIATSRPRRAAVAPSNADGEGPDWHRVINALKRYRWLVVGVSVLGFAATWVLATRAPRAYRASATIWIAAQGETRRTNDVGPIRQNQLLDAEAWVDLLRSYAVIDPVVEAMHLHVQPQEPSDSSALHGLQVDFGFQPGSYVFEATGNGRYALMNAKGLVVERGALGDPVGKALGFRWTPNAQAFPPGRSVRFMASTPRAMSEQIAEALNTRTDRLGTFLRISLEGDDPRRTAAIVNAIAARFVKVAADLKDRRLAELRRILDEQRGRSQVELQRAENALKAFREKAVGLPSTEPEAGATKDDVGPGALGTLRVELDRVRHDRAELARWLEEPADARAKTGALLLTSGTEATEYTTVITELAQKRAELRALQYQYLPEHPRLKRLTQDVDQLERETLPALASRLAGDLATRERDLERRVSTMTAELRTVPARIAQLTQLERGVTIASDLYTMLQQRYQEANLAEVSSLPDARILDGAIVPDRPATNIVPRLLLFGGAASIALALVCAVGLDRMDPRLRYPTEITQKMGLSILGAVPHRRIVRSDKDQAWEVAAEVAEAVRGVRLALEAGGSRRGRVLYTITSPGPGDGKSFITANLGVSFALAGHRTVVIDADTRRGVLHRSFGARRRPGLTEYLKGEASMRQVLQATSSPSLSFIGCGARTKLAPELLGKPAMPALIADLLNEFDVVLCDSPPLSAGVDPLVLAAVTTDVVLVVRTGVSLRNVLEAKLEILDRLPINVVGAVMNDVPPGDLYRPYLYYSREYDAIDEAADEPAVLPVV